MKIKYQTLETIGSVLWLLTDFIWMNGFILTASTLTIPVLLMLLGACLKYDGSKKSEILALTASALWFLMNMLWIYSDIDFKETSYKEGYLLCSKITFIVASVFVFLSFRASRKENETSDFKRLKLK